MSGARGPWGGRLLPDRVQPAQPAAAAGAAADGSLAARARCLRGYGTLATLRVRHVVSVPVRLPQRGWLVPGRQRLGRGGRGALQTLPAEDARGASLR